MGRAASRLLSRRRLDVPKHHNKGPDNVYSKTIIKNITCRSAMISVIKMNPETNIHNGMAPFEIGIFETEIGDVAHHQGGKSIDNK
jgi:hypothetical protein